VIDAVTALGRLLSDPAARAAFAADRDAWLAVVDPPERTTLRGLDAAQLEVQAQVLVDKRRREAAAFLPETLRRLGADGYAVEFGRYAPTHWPRGHLRHPRDALAFLEHLERIAPGRASSQDWAFVRAPLARRESGRRLTWGVSRHRDAGPLAHAAVVFPVGRRDVRLTLALPWPSR